MNTYPPELAEAIAAAYTPEQLKKQIADWVVDLASNPTAITSVNTAGASYTKEITMPLKDLIVLWRQALAIAEGGDAASGNPYAQSARPIFVQTY